MSLNAALFSSDNQHWNTPKIVLDLVRQVAPIEFDPASNPESIVGAERECMTNGLEIKWPTEGLIFCNPPYSDIKAWAEKAFRAADHNSTIIMLVPVRVDTKWFQHMWTAKAICFWHGRLKFLGAPTSAPFPSCLCFWGSDELRYRFIKIFSTVGYVVQP